MPGPQGHLTTGPSQDRAGHLLELELHLPGLRGVLGARQAGVGQGQGQAGPFQPQLYREWGAPGRDPEGQGEGLPVAEPLVAQELLWRQERKAVTISTSLA